jgi:hypothetical protein
MALSPEEEQELELLKSEVAKIANPKRVTTREEALANAEAVDSELEAGPWYMEFAKDMLNPFDAAAGLVTGGSRAAGNAVRGAAKGTAGRALEAASTRQHAINMVKNPARLEGYTRGLLRLQDRRR